jgi:hypothetical protein
MTCAADHSTGGLPSPCPAPVGRGSDRGGRAGSRTLPGPGPPRPSPWSDRPRAARTLIRAGRAGTGRIAAREPPHRTRRVRSVPLSAREPAEFAQSPPRPIVPLGPLRKLRVDWNFTLFLILDSYTHGIPWIHAIKPQCLYYVECHAVPFLAPGISHFSPVQIPVCVAFHGCVSRELNVYITLNSAQSPLGPFRKLRVDWNFTLFLILASYTRGIS